MNISARERWVVIGGVAVAAIAVLFRFMHGGSSTTNIGAGTGLAAAFSRIDDYTAARAAAEQLSRDMQVTLPSGSPGEQELAMRQQLAQAVQSNGLKLGTLRRADAGGRRD